MLNQYYGPPHFVHSNWYTASIRKKCLLSIHIPKALLDISSCGVDATINGPGPSRKYAVWKNIVNALGLMNLFTMAVLALPQALSTVVANDVSKLTMINASGGTYLPTFFCCSLVEHIFFQIHPWPCHYCYILGL